MTKKGLIVGIMECMKSMYVATELCVKWERDQVKERLPQQVRVRQACSLSINLVRIFRGDIVDYTKAGNRHLKLV